MKIRQKNLINIFVKLDMNVKERILSVNSKNTSRPQKSELRLLRAGSITHKQALVSQMCFSSLHNGR